jgi:hypothetical protein
MQVKLTPGEIARAIQHYIAGKTGVPYTSLAVTLHWRGRSATVEVPPIPTLNEAIRRGEVIHTRPESVQAAPYDWDKALKYQR